MGNLLFRVARVTRDESDDSLRLTPGKWGEGELRLGDFVELHRPDGIVIRAPIEAFHYAGLATEISLRNLISFDLIPEGTEVRICDAPSEPRSTSVLRRQGGDRVDRPQHVLLYFRRGEGGWSGSYEREDFGPVMVWFPMHPLLEKVRRATDKWISGNQTPPGPPMSEQDARECLAQLRWLEEAADGDEETIVWKKEPPDIVTPAAWQLLHRAEFAWLVCPKCGARYQPDELKTNRWSSGSGLAASGGATLFCPREHPLLELDSWIS
jgi:hypothetical protein